MWCSQWYCLKLASFHIPMSPVGFDQTTLKQTRKIILQITFISCAVRVICTLQTVYGYEYGLNWMAIQCTAYKTVHRNCATCLTQFSLDLKWPVLKKNQGNGKQQIYVSCKQLKENHFKKMVFDCLPCFSSAL